MAIEQITKTINVVSWRIDRGSYSRAIKAIRSVANEWKKATAQINTAMAVGRQIGGGNGVRRKNSRLTGPVMPESVRSARASTRAETSARVKEAIRESKAIRKVRDKNLEQKSKARLERRIAANKAPVYDPFVGPRLSEYRDLIRKNNIAKQKIAEKEARKVKPTDPFVGPRLSEYRDFMRRNNLAKQKAQARSQTESAPSLVGPVMPPYLDMQRRQRLKDSKAAAKLADSKATRISNAELDFKFNPNLVKLSRTEVAKFRNELKNINMEFRGGDAVSTYNKKLAHLNRQIRMTAAESTSLREKLRSVRSEFLLFSLTAGFAIKQVADTGKKFESSGIMMNTVFGADAANQIGFLREQSQRLGISFLDSAKSYSQMMFAGKAAGMQTTEMQDIYLGISEASKVFGMSQDEVSGSFRAIIQMFSKGTVQAEELRGQLGDRLVGAYNITANAMGLTTEELGDQLKAGKILAKDMVPKLAAALRELAAPGLLSSLDTLETHQARMLNNWNDLKNVIFNSGLGKFMKTLADFGNILFIALKPVGTLIGGIFKGLEDILYWTGAMIAELMDLAVKLGWLNIETDEWNVSLQETGEVIGWLAGILGGLWLTKFLLTLGKVVGYLTKIPSLLRSSFSGAALGGALNAGATSSTATKAASSLGRMLAGLVGKAFSLYFIYELSSAIASGIYSVLSKIPGFVEADVAFTKWVYDFTGMDMSKGKVYKDVPAITNNNYVPPVNMANVGVSYMYGQQVKSQTSYPTNVTFPTTTPESKTVVQVDMAPEFNGMLKARIVETMRDELAPQVTAGD